MRAGERMKKKIRVLFVIILTGIFLFPVFLTLFRSLLREDLAGTSRLSIVGYYDILVEEA